MRAPCLLPPLSSDFSRQRRSPRCRQSADGPETGRAARPSRPARQQHRAAAECRPGKPSPVQGGAGWHCGPTAENTDQPPGQTGTAAQTTGPGTVVSAPAAGLLRTQTSPRYSPARQLTPLLPASAAGQSVQTASPARAAPCSMHRPVGPRGLCSPECTRGASKRS